MKDELFETATRGLGARRRWPSGALGRYGPRVTVSTMVVVVLLGGAFYTARLSEGTPRVVYTASLEQVEDESQDSLRVDINTADVEELDELPEVGPSTAQSIIDYRENNGEFRSVDELKPMPNCKTLDGFTFSVLLNEDGAGRLELTKA
jgi:competence protein ComEA